MFQGVAAFETGFAVLDTASFIGRIEPGEIVIEPAGCRAGDIGNVWAFGLLFEDVCKGVGVACGVTATDFALVLAFCDCEVLDNEIDWWSSIEVLIEIVEIGNQVRAAGKSDSLVQAESNLWNECKPRSEETQENDNDRDLDLAVEEGRSVSFANELL